MILPDENIAYLYGVKDGFENPELECSENNFTKSEYLDYADKVIIENHKRGWLKGTELRKHIIDKLEKQFGEKFKKIEHTMCLYLYDWFEYNFSTQMDVAKLEKEARVIFGFKETQESLDKIINVLENGNFMRGVRLTIAYLYSESLIEEYMYFLRLKLDYDCGKINDVDKIKSYCIKLLK